MRKSVREQCFKIETNKNLQQSFIFSYHDKVAKEKIIQKYCEKLLQDVQELFILELNYVVVISKHSYVYTNSDSGLPITNYLNTFETLKQYWDDWEKIYENFVSNEKLIIMKIHEYVRERVV